MSSCGRTIVAFFGFSKCNLPCMYRFTISLLLLFCGVHAHAQSEWMQRTSPPGTGRHHPIAVANDQFGYVLAGQAGFASLDLDDVYRYDPESDSWEEMGTFPGGGRGYGYGVCEGDDAYIGFGSNNEGYPTDWWHLDMPSGEWTALADFPGVGRNHPAMVLTAGHVFVGLGSNGNNLGDWWAYDIASDSWEVRAQFEWGNRHHPFYFGLDGKAYVGFGHGDPEGGSLTIYRDFHVYDPATDAWTQLADFPGEARVAGTQFAANGKGYILSGDGDNHGPLDYGEFWEYDPASDSWTELPPHPGGARWAPGSFVLGCHAYLTGGFEDGSNTYHHDLWRYSLLPECGCTDPAAVNFSEAATIDDGSCCFVAGCMSETAANYNAEACLDDESCMAPVLGCTDAASSFYNPDANAEVALGGPVSTEQLGGGGFHYNDNWDMLFSVSEPTILTSVDLLAETAFTIDLYIREADGTTIFQAPFALQEGWNTLPIGVEMPNGTGFAMGIEGENEGLFRNNAVPSGAFPIAVADRMSITSNTTDSPLDYYYYFYRWVVESPCEAFTAVDEFTSAVSVFPNPGTGRVTLSGVDAGLAFAIRNILGQRVLDGVTATGHTVLDATDLDQGTYIIEVQGRRPVRWVLQR